MEHLPTADLSGILDTLHAREWDEVEINQRLDVEWQWHVRLVARRQKAVTCWKESATGAASSPRLDIAMGLALRELRLREFPESQAIAFMERVRDMNQAALEVRVGPPGYRVSVRVGSDHLIEATDVSFALAVEEVLTHMRERGLLDQPEGA